MRRVPACCTTRLPSCRMVFLHAPGTPRILLDLVGVAMAGGLFTVPLYAILQHESEPEHRARVIAANNIVNEIGRAHV